MRQEIIQRALAERASDGANSGTIADATVLTLSLLHVELESLVGVQAVRALYARSLHLTRSSFGWLSPAAAELPGELLTALHDDLVSRTPTEARQAVESLLLHFAELLTSLIGEPLTHRLLRSAWGIPAADEHSQEKAR